MGLVSQSKILMQIKKIRNLVTAFETFESISASPGKGEISRLELQVSLMERAGSPHFACAADSKIVDVHLQWYSVCRSGCKGKTEMMRKSKQL